MLRLLIILAITFTMMVPVALAGAPTTFSNVTNTDWSYNAVKELIHDGLVAGDPERFAKSQPISRYEMAILVANGMNNVSKATPEQKTVIEKLSAEFSSELEKIGAKPAKPQAPKQSPVNFTFETRIQYDHTSLGPTDGGGWPAGNVKDQNQFYNRNRLYLSGAINDQWTFVARYMQQTNNWQKSDATSGGVDTSARWDRWYVVGKDVLDGTVQLGRQYVNPGKGGFVQFYQDVNGVTYKKKIGEVTLKLGDYKYVMTGTVPLGANSQEMNYAEMAYKPSATSDVSVYKFRHNWSDSIHDMDITGFSGAVAFKNGWALSGEWVRNSARDAGYNGKTGYFVAIQSKYGPTWRMPSSYGYEEGPSAVNPSIIGDSLWAVSYRHAPAGVAGKFNRGMNTMVPVSTDSVGIYQNSINDVNALRLDYYRVVAKNVQWVVVLDHIKPINGTWTNNAFQTAFIFLFR